MTAAQPTHRTKYPSTPTTKGQDVAERVWTVMLVDDDEDLRLVMRRSLDRATGLRLVAEASDGHTAEELVVEHQPDVVLVDLGLPDLPGDRLIPRLMVAAPHTMVAVLSGRRAEDRETTSRAVGAFAFYEKSMIGHGLMEYLAADRQLFDLALAGEDVVAPSAITRRRVPS